jgi:hypothetical protein
LEAIWMRSKQPFQTCLSCKLNQNLKQDIVYRSVQHFFFLSL